MDNAVHKLTEFIHVGYFMKKGNTVELTKQI